MSNVLGHDYALQGYTGPWTTLANEINFGMIMLQVQDRSLDLLTRKTPQQKNQKKYLTIHTYYPADYR